MEKISILGCGWLGLPLASKFVQKGFVVKGSTTTKSKIELLRELGIDPYLIDLDNNTEQLSQFLKDSRYTVINIPPKFRSETPSAYPAKLRTVTKALENSRIENVILISSTSVYENDPKFSIVTETGGPYGTNLKAKNLLAAEDIFKNNPYFETAVVRFAGLIGEDRHPAQFLSGKSNIKNPEAPVNLIHRKDCIGLIKQVIESKSFPICVNGTFPMHPSKTEYYHYICEKRGLTPPSFTNDEPSEGKTVSASISEDLLRYTYRHSIY